jgi:hypothetical protein
MITIKGDYKICRTESYNYDFNMKTGFFARWGKTKEDDPQFAPLGPEIIDFEITTKCNGVNGKLCKYCYKSNTPDGKNISLETFKQVIEKINCNNQVTQLAFGLGSSAEENPALWDMCKYLRENNIIPNGTVADITQKTAEKIAKNFGAVAISIHLPHVDTCYNQVKMLTDLIGKENNTLVQTNIHFVLCEETLNAAHKHLEAVKTDPRLAKLNATVFLQLKQKGRAEGKQFHPVSYKAFSKLVNKALEEKISIGFDSCAGQKFASAIKNRSDK